MAKKNKIKRKVKRVDEIQQEIIADISKDFGDMSFLEDEEQLHILPTIIPSLNRASFVGGIPGGSIIELHGPNQGGKTVLGVALLISAQKQGHTTVLYDYEGSFKDRKWPEALGADLKSILYRSPKSYEEGAEDIRKLVIKYSEKQANEKKLKDRMLWILVDSITAMTPEDILYGKIGKANFGLHSKITSEWLQGLNALIKGTNISVIFINQERVKVGAGPFEKKWKSSGGEALQFYAHVRIRVLQSSVEKDSQKRVTGKSHRFIVEKCKVSAPDELGYFYTSNGKITPLGFDMPKTYFKEAVTQNVLKKKGSKYFCNYDEETQDGLMEAKFIIKIRDDKKMIKWFNKKFEFRRNKIESEQG